MLHRSAHYWLCCTELEVDTAQQMLNVSSVSIKRAQGPKTKFGPFDYLFIDASDVDKPADLLLEALLEKLEARRDIVESWGRQQISGVTLLVRSSKGQYSEAISSDTLERLALLKLQLSLKYEHLVDAKS